VHRLWYILCSFDDRMLPGVGWSSVDELLKYLLLNKLKEWVGCEIFVKLFRSGVFMKRCKYWKLSAEVGMFSRG